MAEKREEEAVYRGITPDALWLLAENRFQNSKEFYESKKPAIKEQVLIPMQQICAALADMMEKLMENQRDSKPDDFPHPPRYALHQG